MSLNCGRLLGTAVAIVVFISELSLSVNSATAEGSNAQAYAYRTQPSVVGDYVSNPVSGFNPFVPAGGIPSITTSFANAGVADADGSSGATATGDAFGIISQSGLNKNIGATWNVKNGNFFAFARAKVEGTRFQIQGDACNDFNGDGQCDVLLTIEIPRATVDLPQQLVADDPTGILDVQGCEFAPDQSACEQNGAAQAFDVSLRYDANVEIPSQEISSSIFGQVTLSGNGQLSYEMRQQPNIFQVTNAFGDPVTDQFGRTTAKVDRSILIREYLINTDNETYLSPFIIIDERLTLNGPPLPGVRAEDILPDQPIEDFFDPLDQSLQIPYYGVFGIDENDPRGTRGAGGNFGIVVNVGGGVIVPEPSAIYLLVCGIVAGIFRRRRS